MSLSSRNTKRYGYKPQWLSYQALRLPSLSGCHTKCYGYQASVAVIPSVTAIEATKLLRYIVTTCNGLGSKIGMAVVVKCNTPHDLEAALVVMPSSRSNVRYITWRFAESKLLDGYCRGR